MLRATDAVGLVGESEALTVNVPGTTGNPPVGVLDTLYPQRSVKLPPPGRRLRASRAVRASFAAARRFHRRRGVRLTARLGTARSAKQWRGLLRTERAGRFVGFATFRGHVLLGPVVVEGLESLDNARTGPGERRLTRREAEGMATAAAVLLHETLHASGPQALHDYRLSPSGRAFEEGFTESATIDLLGPFLRSLKLPPRLRRPLLAAVGRYRGPYAQQVAWARRLSSSVTGAHWRSARARRWRLDVADRWGTDRWERLSKLTGRSAGALRRGAPDPDSGRRLF